MVACLESQLLGGGVGGLQFKANLGKVSETLPEK
jgi:hypothetical protein